MPKFSAYMKGGDGSAGPPGASIINGVLANESMLPVPNQGKYAFLVGTSDPKHLWVWNDQKDGENKWEDQGTTASEIGRVTASVSTVPWSPTFTPSIQTQFSTSNQIDYLNFDFTLPEAQPAGFGNVSITTQQLSYTSTPTATVSTDGDDWNKNFHFNLGIPEGAPGGFSTYQPTSVSTLKWDAPATVKITNITTSPNSNKSFKFDFGIPEGHAAGFSTFSANIQSIGWTEDPTVSISESGPNWGKNIDFNFKVPKTRPAGFGASTDATAITTAWDTQPQVSVSTDGEDWEKNFHFGFEIPAGRPAGFGDINVTTDILTPDENPWVKVNSVTNSPDYKKDFNFEFGIPKGIAAGFSTKQYVSVSTLDMGEQATVEITTITTSPETAKEFNFHFGLPKGDALSIYDGITFTSTEDGSDYYWKYEGSTTTLVFNRGTLGKLPIYIYNNNNDELITSNFKISTTTIEYNTSNPFDGTMYLMMPATLQDIEAGTASTTTYGNSPIVSKSTGSTSTKTILDFTIPEGKPGAISNTASGNIVSFDDGLNAPVTDLKVGIEPVQDLHGYDHPWPAGGGKNLLPLTVDGIKAVNYSGTWNGNVYTRYGITYTLQTDSDNNVTGILVNGTNTHDNAIQFYLSNEESSNFMSLGEGTEYKIKSHGHSGNDINIRIGDKDNNYVASTGSNDLGTFTADEKNTIRIYIAASTTLDNELYTPILMLSSEIDDTFEPYSNICSISGWTGMNVQRAEKNIWDEEWETGQIDSVTGNNNQTSGIRTKNYISVKPNQSYFACINSTSSGATFRTRWYDINKNYIGYSPTISCNNSFTVPANAYYLRLCPQTSYGETYLNDISINYPATDTAYHAYQGTTYPVSWETEAGTVYGGSLNVTTGVLTVDRAMVTFDGSNDESWTYSESYSQTNAVTFYNTVRLSNAKYNIKTKVNVITNMFIVEKRDDIKNNDSQAAGFSGNDDNNPYPTIKILRTIAETVEDFRAFLASTPVIFCYELATPLTIQLTPTEVTTLLGVNNLWADSGDINISYIKNTADGTLIKKIIDNKKPISNYDYCELNNKDIVRFDDGAEASIGNLKVDIEPVQDLHGYDHPWPAGGSTNLLPKATQAYVNTPGVTVTIADDGTITLNGTATATGFIDVPLTTPLPIGNYSISFFNNKAPESGNRLELSLRKSDIDSPVSESWITSSEVNKSKSFTLTNVAYYWRIQITNGSVLSDFVCKPMLVSGSTPATSYTPYSNICPISGWTGCNINVSPTLSTEDATVYPISWSTQAGTVYGGSLDVTTGVLTVDKVFEEFDGSQDEDWSIINTNTQNWIYSISAKFATTPWNNTTERSFSNLYPNASLTNSNTSQGWMIGSTSNVRIRWGTEDTIANFKTSLSSKPFQICYELANPITYQLTPTEVTTLLGVNNIWTDTGNINNILYFRNTIDGTSIGKTITNLNNNINTNINTINNHIINIESSISDLEAQSTFKRYGVSGIGLQSASLTRLYDAVGMTAQVGTDDPSVTVTNDFDNAAPFMHKKCVGHWIKEGDHAKFVVQAYLGDSNYAEDGTMGDYVAVELPLSFYYLNGSTLIISAHKYDGYRPFDIFCRNHNENDLLGKIYVPAYALALNEDGYAVSLPDLDNEQGDYATLFTKARNYNNNKLSGMGMLMPASLQFYYWALMNVEFATQNCQSVMQGCASLRHSNDDTCKFLDTTHVLVGNWQTARVIGEYVAIIDATVDYNNTNYKATHRIVSITKADASGAPLESGTYTNVEVEDLDKAYYDYDVTGETTYQFVARPWRTGSCNNVVSPSGSPVSNENGYYPMRYRYRENVYGNHYHTSVDLFDVRQGSNDNDYYLEWFYLSNPTAITTPTNPDKTALLKAPYIKLSLITPHENYATGYIVSKQYDETYPDIWAPLLTSGGSISTYYCDNAILVSSSIIRSCRLGGSWYHGAPVGLSFLSAASAPSTANASYGGDLCFPQ